MFTGIVEETGEVVSLVAMEKSARLTLRAAVVTQDVRVGDSVAVNGCCLTVTELGDGGLSFDLLHETLQRTNLKAASAGALVNLERALAVSARLGGHFVQGHIDCTSPVIAFEKVGADHRLEILLPVEFSQYVAYKGSVAINGISLTVAELKDSSMVVWVIPHTMEVTNLRAMKAGDLVNLEFDMLAKYVERILGR